MMRTYSGMEFRAKLAKLRQERGLSQGDLGTAVGLHQSRISKWEKGDGEPSMKQAARLAITLRVPLDYLADDAIDEPPAPALTADEAILLWMARKLGVETAMDRLLDRPDHTNAARDFASDPPPQQPASRRQA